MYVRVAHSVCRDLTSILSLCVADTPVCYQVEGSRQALRFTLYLDSCHFSELPSRLQNGGSLKLHTVLFTRGKTGHTGTDFLEKIRQRQVVESGVYQKVYTQYILYKFKGSQFYVASRPSHVHFLMLLCFHCIRFKTFTGCWKHSTTPAILCLRAFSISPSVSAGLGWVDRITYACLPNSHWFSTEKCQLER